MFLYVLYSSNKNNYQGSSLGVKDAYGWQTTIIMYWSRTDFLR